MAFQDVSGFGGTGGGGAPGPPGPAGLDGSALERVEYRTISGVEDAAKALTLAASPATATRVRVDVVEGSGSEEYAVDFTVAGNVLSWGGLGLDVAAAPVGVGIIATDKIRVMYFV